MSLEVEVGVDDSGGETVGWDVDGDDVARVEGERSRAIARE